MGKSGKIKCPRENAAAGPAVVGVTPKAVRAWVAWRLPPGPVSPQQAANLFAELAQQAGRAFGLPVYGAVQPGLARVNVQGESSPLSRYNAEQEACEVGRLTWALVLAFADWALVQGLSCTCTCHELRNPAPALSVGFSRP